MLLRTLVSMRHRCNNALLGLVVRLVNRSDRITLAVSLLLLGML